MSDSSLAALKERCRTGETYEESEKGWLQLQKDCDKALQDDFSLNEDQAHIVTDYVWYEGYERGWECDFDRYVDYATEIGAIARNVLEKTRFEVDIRAC